MTELNPLEYTASVTLLIVLVAWVSALNGAQGDKVRSALWLPIGIPLAIGQWVAGKSFGVLRFIVFLGWSWTDLWVPPIAQVLGDWWDELDAYCAQQSYIPNHGA